MSNVEYMMKVINNVVFAQLDIVTSGTCYDEGIELFRTNSKGEKIGEYTIYNATGFLGALERDCL